MGDWVLQRCDDPRMRGLVARVRAGQLGRYAELAGGDPRFGAWLYLVGGWLLRTVGVRHEDPADRRWRDDFDAGVSPVGAARAALTGEFTTLGG